MNETIALFSAESSLISSCSFVKLLKSLSNMPTWMIFSSSGKIHVQTKYLMSSEVREALSLVEKRDEFRSMSLKTSLSTAFLWIKCHQITSLGAFENVQRQIRVLICRVVLLLLTLLTLNQSQHLLSSILLNGKH